MPRAKTKLTTERAMRTLEMIMAHDNVDSNNLSPALILLRQILRRLSVSIVSDREKRSQTQSKKPRTIKSAKVWASNKWKKTTRKKDLSCKSIDLDESTKSSSLSIWGAFREVSAITWLSLITAWNCSVFVRIGWKPWELKDKCSFERVRKASFKNNKRSKNTLKKDRSLATTT